MIDQELLTILKTDLQLSSPALDPYLEQLVRAARSFIADEGITLTPSYSDAMLVEMYAAYLYRRRREENAPMPRMLRWALNNRLFSQKGGGGKWMS